MAFINVNQWQSKLPSKCHGTQLQPPVSVQMGISLGTSTVPCLSSIICCFNCYHCVQASSEAWRTPEYLRQRKVHVRPSSFRSPIGTSDPMRSTRWTGQHSSHVPCLSLSLVHESDSEQTHLTTIASSSSVSISAWAVSEHVHHTPVGKLEYLWPPDWLRDALKSKWLILEEGQDRWTPRVGECRLIIFYIWRFSASISCYLGFDIPAVIEYLCASIFW